MRKLVLITLGALVVATAISGGAGALDPSHENVASGGLDPDGDHYRTSGGSPSNDPQPNVYCATAHADVPTGNPPTAPRNGAITLTDFLTMVVIHGNAPPSPFHDQNHNDVVDWPDVNHVASRFGTTVSGACNSVVPDTMPVTGPSAFENGGIGFSTSPPPSGQFPVNVLIGGSTNPARGYFVKLYFNEQAVQFVSASHSGPGGPENLCPPNFTGSTYIDNADDAAGDDGSVAVGCPLAASTSGSLSLTLTFDRISAQAPNFHLGTCGAPDSLGTLGGSYTISADDHGPMVGPGEDPCAPNTALVRLAVDADPLNGSGPCSIIDPTKTVWAGLAYDAAVCLVDGDAPSNIDLRMSYNGTILTAPDIAPDGGEDLDGNPDLNGGAGTGIGSAWDCSIGGVNPPNGAPSPATLLCAGTAGLTAPGHIATVHLVAGAAGVDQLRFASGSGIDGIDCHAPGQAQCVSATFNVLQPPAPTCQSMVLGALSGAPDYFVRANSFVFARGQVPLGKTTATLNVRWPGGALLATRTVNGPAGTPVELPFTVIPPGPLTLECVVPGLANEVLTLNVLLIDPAGRIYDAASGASIAGATVTLQIDSDTGPGQSWVTMSPSTHAGFFEPAVNPEITGLDGRYAWDVAPYYPQPIPAATNDFRVQVSAPGCTSATSAVVAVPPPTTTLDVPLTCTDSDGDGIRNQDETSLLGTNPAVADTDGDGTTDGDEDSDGDGLNDADEIAASTSPLDTDTDDDTLSDYAELIEELTSPLLTDTELDGCSDAEELGSTTSAGGNRDPLSEHDFFDVPVPANGPAGTDGKLTLSASSIRNRAVALTDVGTVLAYVGRTTASIYYTGDLNNDGRADGAQLDRTPSTVHGQPWRSGAPNGAVSLQDVGVALSQVGHSCVAAP